LGELYQKDAEALASAPGKEAEAIQAYAKAITEFINVFAQYSASDWGPKAGLRAQEIKTVLKKKYDKDVKWTMDEKAIAQVSEASFRLADNLYRQKKYPEAIAEYAKILKQYPEGESSLRALANMLDAYIQSTDALMIKATAEYLGERFGGQNTPAMALLAAGKTYFDRKDEPMYTYFYETYLNYFPKHDRAAAILLTLAGLRKSAGDEAGAAKYYERIVENYPKDQAYPKALSAMAWGYFMATNYAGAVKGFNLYLPTAQPNPDKVQAQFALAESHRMLGAWPEALAEYEKLIGWLVPKNNPYATSAADAKKNADVLERAVFQRAFSYSRMGGAPEEIKENRLKGIRAYDQFIASFPNSTLASKALDAKGRMQLEIGQFDAAAKTFDDLAAKYPTTDEGRNALFSLIRSAMEVKQYEQALSAFERMYGNRDKFTPDEFARVGQLMLDAGQYPQAIEAFQDVVSRSEERGLLERALFGLGRAAFEQGQFAEAAKAMDDLMTRYPKSGTFYEAKFIQARASKELNKLPEAIAALGDIMKYADDTVLRNRTTFELAVIQKQQGDKNAALASFLRVALLADAKNPELTELVEKSLMEGIDLGMEIEDYQVVLDCCEQYMAEFPEGSRIEDARRLRGEARMKAAAAASKPAVTNAPGK
ncbi:MAG: tetratricopeptide repeat protein, partial [Verrucomicrobia bacterium]|nr:tetratricopeptide repeat protein [Verrucomicrobiota bacterium]